METQTCLPHLAEALLLPHGDVEAGGLEAPAEMGGVRKLLQRCEGRLLQGWRGQEAAAFSVSVQGMLCCCWDISAGCAPDGIVPRQCWWVNKATVSIDRKSVV